MLEIYNLIHNVDECCSTELSIMMEIFYICGLQYSRQQRHMTIEQLKYG